MGRKYLGGSGERLTIWISVYVHATNLQRASILVLTHISAASTVLLFYGYDQVRPTVPTISNQH